MAVEERTRSDLCPGVLRPWQAKDGALVRLRVVGGEISQTELAKLSSVAIAYGDGNIRLTRRANLQLRALPHTAGGLPADLVAAFEDTGLLPSPTHELVRNIMVSPLSGSIGGRADIWGVAHDLDAILCADPAFAGLPGRFLFVLDDGRGDLAGRTNDLGLVALDSEVAQIRVGTESWGDVVGLDRVADALGEIAREFLGARGEGTTAHWNIDELVHPLASAGRGRDKRAKVSAPPLDYGPVADAPGLTHVRVPDGVLTPELTATLLGSDHERLVVTPWQGVLVGSTSRD